MVSVCKHSIINPTDAWRNSNVIITSKRRRLRRFDVIMTLVLRRVSAGRLDRNIVGEPSLFHILTMLADMGRETG